MSGRLPVISGAELVTALGELGWCSGPSTRRHVRLRHPDRPVPLVVPLHRELKRGTLAGILCDADIRAEELRP